MQLLVELFDDHEIMHNLFAPHGFRPEAVAFLTDPEEDGDQAKKICAALRKRYPWMDVFVCPVCYTDFSSIQAALSALYALYPRPVFELSGGNGIARILAERFCAEHDLPRYYVNYETRRFFDLGGACSYFAEFAPPKLRLEDLAWANGAGISGGMHSAPPERWHGAILTYFRKTLETAQGWGEFSRYLQEVTHRSPEHGRDSLWVNAPRDPKPGRKNLRFHEKLALEAERLGFLEKLKIKEDRVSFRYADLDIRNYMTTQGSFLEMFMYILARRTGRFSDCRMSVVLDWDGELTEKGNVVNEIDVVLMDGINPLFISCKTSLPSADDLNEIFLYSRRFGGSHARTALITTTPEHRIPSMLCRRAEEMDIGLVTRESLTQRKILELLE